MEIMGLAVIVILLAIGMFFVTKFSLGTQQTSQAATSQMRQTAIGFVNTLLNTDAGCEGVATFSKLLEEMAAPDYSMLDCAKDPLYFETAVKSILDETVDRWGYKYKLLVYYSKDSPRVKDNELSDVIEIRHPECLENMEEETAPAFAIPTDYKDIRVIMTICY